MESEIIKILLETFLTSIYVSLIALFFTSSVYSLIYGAEKCATRSINNEKLRLKDFGYFIISLAILFSLVQNGPNVVRKLIPEIINHL